MPFAGNSRGEGDASVTRCCGCACGGGCIMPRKRSWDVHYCGCHLKQAHCKETAIAKDTTLNNARTRGSTPGYAVFGKAECGYWRDDYREYQHNENAM